MLQKFHSLFLFGLLAIGLCVPFGLSAEKEHQRIDDGDDVVIVILPREGNPSNPPRNPSMPRIEASYCWSTSSVSASLSNAGDVVEVAFYNFSTGEDYAFEIPGSGLSAMPIGDSSGFWTVTFILSSGAVYYGTFIL